MNVLNILQCTNLGGMEQSSLRLMNGLKDKFSFSVLSVHPFGALKSFLDRLEIASVDCSYCGVLGLLSHLELRKKLRKIGIDRPIIMTGPTISGILALPKKRAYKRILMVHFHHEGVHSTWAWRLLYRLALERFDLITYPSAFVRDEALEILPQLKPRSMVVRNVIELPGPVTKTKRREARVRLGLDSEAFVIGNAGWLIPRKRFDVFLEVAAKIGLINNVQFVIAGDGELRSHLENMARTMGLGEKVRFLGWVDRMDDFYLALDCLVFNTDWDAMGMTALEAMSYGLPVVASAVKSGLKEVLVSGTGFLYATHDIQGMAGKIEQLIQDSELRERIGIAARQRIVDLSQPNYTLEPVIGCLSGDSFDCRDVSAVGNYSNPSVSNR